MAPSNGNLMRFICLKTTEPLRQGKLLLATKSPGVPVTLLIDLERIED